MEKIDSISRAEEKITRKPQYEVEPFRVRVNLQPLPEEAGIQVSVYCSFDDIQDPEQWDRFVESVGGDIYLTYDWCRIWWDHYGTKRDLRIYLFRQNGELVGLVPMFVETIWLGPVWTRVAKIVGCDHTMVMVNPPVRSDCATAIFDQVLTDLAVQCKCDLVHFGPISGQWGSIEGLREAGRSSDHVVPIRDSIRSPYTVFHLPESFDEYVTSLGKSRKWIQRDLVKFEKSLQVSQDIIGLSPEDDNIILREFEHFVTMHNEQWKREGKLGHFKDWPLGTQFNTAVVLDTAKRGRLRLIRQLVNNQVISYMLCFVFRDVLYARLPAKLVGLEWDKFALGKIGLFKAIDAAISQGVREIEAGAGHYDYKVKLGGKEYPLYSILYVRNQWFVRLRAYLFLKLADGLHFCYYRVWFNKLAPKLPFKRRPLWKAWIKARL